ncbi:MAG: hypothetical protein LR017_01645 [Candidatus Pacebacteria bacterium]|nr:hypothetical protein [Candidatus Paceibacterota bacterium]
MGICHPIFSKQLDETLGRPHPALLGIAPLPALVEEPNDQSNELQNTHCL